MELDDLQQRDRERGDDDKAGASKTPRTDAAQRLAGTEWKGEMAVDANFARVLERELNAALKLTNINVESELLQRTNERDAWRQAAETAGRALELHMQFCKTLHSVPTVEKPSPVLTN